MEHLLFMLKWVHNVDSGLALSYTILTNKQVAMLELVRSLISDNWKHLASMTLLLYVGTCSMFEDRGKLGHRLTWLYLLGGFEISFDESPITSPSFLAIAAFGKMPSLFCKPQSKVC